MKTPLQELINELQDIQRLCKKYEQVIYIDAIRSIIENKYLPKETNLFIEIYQDGFQENIRPRHEDAIEYLQSKFESI